MKEEGMLIPSVTFKYRVRTDGKPITYVDNNNGNANPFEFKDITTGDIFNDKRVVVFSLPGAYTPTCSTYQVPGFEENYDAIKEMGIDEIYVLSVNDTFVMRQWMIHQGCKNIKFIPDGNAEFTEGMDMLNCMTAVGFGNRSRRYAMVVNDGVIEKLFVEPMATEEDPDPYGETSPESVMKYLKSTEKFEFIKGLK
jgi:peroxiredoxin